MQFRGIDPWSTRLCRIRVTDGKFTYITLVEFFEIVAGQRKNIRSWVYFKLPMSLRLR